MKLKKQDTTAEENGHDEIEKSDSSNVQVTDDDKTKGDFKNFKISKKTIKKLKGYFQQCKNWILQFLV